MYIIDEQDTDGRVRAPGLVADPVVRTEACMHDLISATAAKGPDDVAIHTTLGTTTYAQLEKLATSLSLDLVSQGVGPEVFVAVAFDKSPKAIISMLAVLKAGGVRSGNLP